MHRHNMDNSLLLSQCWWQQWNCRKNWTSARAHSQVFTLSSPVMLFHCIIATNTVLNKDTHMSANIQYTHTHSASYLIHYKVGRTCRQPDIEQMRSLDSVCACVFLGTVDEGVLSWRLRREVMAGGRLAHTPQCDQQEKIFYCGHIRVQTQNCPGSQLQFWAEKNGHHLYTHIWKLALSVTLSFLINIFFHPWCDEGEM